MNIGDSDNCLPSFLPTPEATSFSRDTPIATNQKMNSDQFMIWHWHIPTVSRSTDQLIFGIQDSRGTDLRQDWPSMIWPLTPMWKRIAAAAQVNDAFDPFHPPKNAHLTGWALENTKSINQGESHWTGSDFTQENISGQSHITPECRRILEAPDIYYMIGAGQGTTAGLRPCADVHFGKVHAHSQLTPGIQHDCMHTGIESITHLLCPWGRIWRVNVRSLIPTCGMLSGNQRRDRWIPVS